MLAARIEPNLLDEAFVILDAKLNDDVNQQVQQTFDVGSCKVAAALILLNQKNQLLKGQFRARGVNTGDGSRVSRIHVPQIVECLFCP